MLRPSLLPLIRRVRSLLGEQDESQYQCSFWSDNAIADALQERSQPVYRGEVTIVQELTEGVLVAAAEAGFDESARLERRDGTTVNPLYSDCVAGRWLLNADDAQEYVDYSRFFWNTMRSVAGETRYANVTVTGASYDIYGTAADLCLVKATAKACKYDVQSGDQKLSRSQEATALLKMAEEYKAKARIGSSSIVRMDMY